MVMQKLKPVRRSYKVRARIAGQAPELKTHEGDRGVAIKQERVMLPRKQWAGKRAEFEKRWFTWIYDVAIGHIGKTQMAVAERVSDTLYVVDRFFLSARESSVNREVDRNNFTATLVCGHEGGPITKVPFYEDSEGIRIFPQLTHLVEISAKCYLDDDHRPVTKWVVAKIGFEPRKDKAAQPDRIGIREDIFQISFSAPLRERFTRPSLRNQPMPSKLEVMKMIEDHIHQIERNEEVAKDLCQFSQAMAVTAAWVFGIEEACLENLAAPQPKTASAESQNNEEESEEEEVEAEDADDQGDQSATA